MNASAPFQKIYPIGRDKEFTIQIAGPPVKGKNGARGGQMRKKKSLATGN